MLLRRNVKESRSYIKKLFNNKKTEPSIRSCLDVCLQIYALAIFDAKEAFQDYNAKRYGDANTHVNAVGVAPHDL
ncbi:hypothetical protein F3Y22_tig00110481pilonHSYRG00039 [Hibiscus syriacus]|uniref:Uncharacterized protein n=1 Tax=Hibiscus syriacus TaxID=106335 RepID=A0A6A3AG78_HIBSY|nr:hypothetical protein F3Y22_tig00110481pilonHSYRG00039 [Hibiscus syriacus]